MDVSSMCRICLVQDVTMYCLVNTKLQDIYEKLTATSFQSEDSRPLRVCYMCYGRLQSCHRLHLNCIKSEQLLTKILTKKELKPKQLEDMSTLKIVHPLVRLWYVPVNVEVTHDDEADHKMEPVDMVHVHVKEENIEDAQDDYISDEFSEQYTAVTDIVKVEHVTEEDINVPNYGTNIRRAKYNITTKRDEDNIQDAKPNDSNVDVNIQNDIKPTKFSDMLLQPIEILTKTMDLECIEASASIENPKLVEVSFKVENVVEVENTRSKKRQVNKHVRKREKVNEVHTDDNPFKCDVCGKGFIGRRHLLIHKLIHSGEKPYKCDMCDKSFVRSHHLKYHSRVHTGEKPYKCDVCEKHFTQKHSLTLHKRLHTGEKPYKCDRCDKSFKQKFILIDHMRTHTGEKPFKCDLCEKYFSRYQVLAVHKRTHTGEKPYKCDTCGQDFFQKQHLVRHSLRHTGEKPYKCDVCKKAFTTNGILTAHYLIHTGEKLYKCDVCEKCFIQKHNLTRHIRAKHREAGDPSAYLK